MRLLIILRKQEGFSIVEVLISMAIFGILMIAFLSLFSSAFFMTLRSGDRDKTVAGISGKVENKIASSSYTDTAITQTTPDVVLIFGDGTTETIPAEKTTGTAQMQDGTSVTIDYLKEAAP